MGLREGETLGEIVGLTEGTNVGNTVGDSFFFDVFFLCQFGWKQRGEYIKLNEYMHCILLNDIFHSNVQISIASYKNDRIFFFVRVSKMYPIIYKDVLKWRSSNLRLFGGTLWIKWKWNVRRWQSFCGREYKMRKVWTNLQELEYAGVS